MRVRIELVKVDCGNTEDVTGADEFYVMGALTDGTHTKGVLTSPFDINDGQTRSFKSAQQLIFDADVPTGQTVRGGLKAFDEDFAKDWSKYDSTVNTITEAVAGGLAASGNPQAAAAGTILKFGVKGFSFFASQDEDDELGTIELNVPAEGPSIEDKEWKFRKKGSIFNPGISTWSYNVHYRITRGSLLPNWQLLDNNPASTAIVADGNDLYQLHSSGRIWKYTGTPLTGWQELDNNPATKQIAAAGGNLYQIHNTGAIWKYVGPPLTGWQQLDNNSASIAIVAVSSNLYQIHNNGFIWKFTG